MTRFQESKKMYEALGIDVEAAMRNVQKFPVSMHCWQGDDVTGFDGAEALSGGIQTTGNYQGKARTPEELMCDIEEVLRMVPGTKRLNLHACYAIFEPGKEVDRDELKPEHFTKWVAFAKKHDLGLDFNPTMFSHPKASGLTLASPDQAIRSFWIRHCQACLRIAEYFAKELDTYCLVNIWIPDGFKDIPADRLTPRKRYMESLDEILSMDYDREHVLVCLESKVFGIGMESYTVGSSEFTLNYAKTRSILPLMDNGHYHPTEQVADKLSALLLFHDKVALHVTRPVRWDSDHVVLFDDETRELAKEIVCHDAMDRVLVGLDFFDASINRISAWAVGMRNMEKAMLYACLQPEKKLKQLQEEENWTALMALQEEVKTMPFGDIWREYCIRNKVADEQDWFHEIERYEVDVLKKRG